MFTVFQVGTGQVTAAWIGMFMFGVANGEYMYGHQTQFKAFYLHRSNKTDFFLPSDGPTPPR